MFCFLIKQTHTPVLYLIRFEEIALNLEFVGGTACCSLAFVEMLGIRLFNYVRNQVVHESLPNMAIGEICNLLFQYTYKSVWHGVLVVFFGEVFVFQFFLWDSCDFLCHVSVFPCKFVSRLVAEKTSGSNFLLLMSSKQTVKN